MEHLIKSDEEKDQLRVILAGLDRYDKLMLMMRYADGLTDNEIAVVMDVSPLHVRYRLSQTTSSIRARLRRTRARLSRTSVKV